jgi:hypothetical protein
MRLRSAYSMYQRIKILFFSKNPTANTFDSIMSDTRKTQQGS